MFYLVAEVGNLASLANKKIRQFLRQNGTEFQTFFEAN
jgi:hypothetical protein